MPKKKRRYKDEHEIIALINQCHRDSNAALKEAEGLEALAKEYFKHPEMVDDAKLKMVEAERLREKARRLIDNKAKSLGDKLAEFRTETMPFLSDNTVQGL